MFPMTSILSLVSTSYHNKIGLFFLLSSSSTNPVYFHTTTPVSLSLYLTISPSYISFLSLSLESVYCPTVSGATNFPVKKLNGLIKYLKASAIGSSSIIKLPYIHFPLSILFPLNFISSFYVLSSKLNFLRSQYPTILF